MDVAELKMADPANVWDLAISFLLLEKCRYSFKINKTPLCFFAFSTKFLDYNLVSTAIKKEHNQLLQDKESNLLI
jgi:hypothetical protein